MNLYESGHDLICVDNLTTGSKSFLREQIFNRIKFFDLDISEVTGPELLQLIGETETIYHIAANADVRGGWNSSFKDIKQNIIATHNIAEYAKFSHVKEVIFTSTGCVYGEPTVIPTPENSPFPKQTSLYGASKIASEGILSSYSEQNAFKTTVLRFVSVLGKNYHHGHVIDFVRQLYFNPKELKILGNGKQRKSYINVLDCINALTSLRSNLQFDVFNIGQNNFIEVNESAQIICEKMNVEPTIITQESKRGWIGDNPFTYLDISKAKSYGWEPKFTINDSLLETVEWILANDWILSKQRP